MVYKHQEEVDLVSIGVYSNWALIYTIIASIYYTLQYSEYNENHQIFPQTNLTSLLSFELYCNFSNIISQALALGFYILQYILCKVLIQMNGNVKLAYEFNLSFIMVGFFVNLFYGLLLISLIILIVTLLRKLRWWALALYIGIVVILWLTRDENPFGRIINFYALETSLTVFFCKVIGSWLLLQVLCFIVNQNTNMIKAEKYHYPQIVINAIILVTLPASILISFTAVHSYNSSEFWTQNETFDYAKDKPACIINASNLPANSTLYYPYDYMKTNCNTNIGEQNATEDEIRIYFKPKQDMRDYINITAFTNPRIDASLVKNNLIIKVEYDKDIKVISLYPYSTPMQFDCYKDKPLAKKYSGGMSGTKSGMIEITVPKEKNYKTQIINSNTSD